MNSLISNYGLAIAALATPLLGKLLLAIIQGFWPTIFDFNFWSRIRIYIKNKIYSTKLTRARERERKLRRILWLRKICYFRQDRKILFISIGIDYIIWFSRALLLYLIFVGSTKIPLVNGGEMILNIVTFLVGYVGLLFSLNFHQRYGLGKSAKWKRARLKLLEENLLQAKLNRIKIASENDNHHAKTYRP